MFYVTPLTLISVAEKVILQRLEFLMSLPTLAKCKICFRSVACQAIQKTGFHESHHSGRINQDSIITLAYSIPTVRPLHKYVKLSLPCRVFQNSSTPYGTCLVIHVYQINIYSITHVCMNRNLKQKRCLDY